MKFASSSRQRSAWIDENPREVETKVVTKLYEDAKRMDWAYLPAQLHSVQYAKWVDDPEVGGRLREFLSPSDARVWIKDGPMKEWSRAVSGFGKYAALVQDAEDLPLKLVPKALGADWEADPGLSAQSRSGSLLGEERRRPS